MELWEEEKEISEIVGVPMRIKFLFEGIFDYETQELLDLIGEESELCT